MSITTFSTQRVISLPPVDAYFKPITMRTDMIVTKETKEQLAKYSGIGDSYVAILRFVNDQIHTKETWQWLAIQPIIFPEFSEKYTIGHLAQVMMN